MLFPFVAAQVAEGPLQMPNVQLGKQDERITFLSSLVVLDNCIQLNSICYFLLIKNDKFDSKNCFWNLFLH